MPTGEQRLRRHLADVLQQACSTAGVSAVHVQPACFALPYVHGRPPVQGSSGTAHLGPLLQALLPLPLLQLLQRLLAARHLALVKARQIIPAIAIAEAAHVVSATDEWAGGSRTGACVAAAAATVLAAMRRAVPRALALPQPCCCHLACRRIYRNDQHGRHESLSSHLCALGSKTTSRPLSRF